jgi:hypothetical protein
VSESTEETPRLYKFLGAYGQIRVRNTHPTYQMRSPWLSRGVKQYAVLSSADCHPADIEHMQRATITVRRFETDKYGAKCLVMEQQPMLVPIDVPT